MAVSTMMPYRTDPQDFSASGVDAGRLHSRTFFECLLKAGTDTMTVPVQTCTTIGELKEVLAAQMGYIEAQSLSFVVKQGVSYKKMLDTEQVLHKMTVTGLKSFQQPRHEYPHPYGIIGCGYCGMKTALTLKTNGSNNFVMFDRYDRVGGHAWLEMCNKTTKLQTEFGTYHLWYGPEWSYEGSMPMNAPIDREIWPSSTKVAEHFHEVAESFGLLPNIHLRANVAQMDVVGKVNDRERYYELAVDPVIYERKKTQGGGPLDHQLNGKKDALADLKEGSTGIRDRARETFRTKVSCLCMWPGALVFPRPVVYKGEETFGGPIDYAVEMRFDYSHVTGRVVCIVGHGAFTMENVRTCLEERAKHMYLLCRKVNLTCPRPVSWFINQSNPPMSAAQLLDMLSHVYLPMVKSDGQTVDPWAVHSVYANAAKTHATIMQKTRFGIGDVYFLAQAYGLLEIKCDEVKRVTHQTLHLESGNRLECECVLKCTGCLGDWKVDRLLKIKEMRGMLVNGDFRRVCSGEPDGINAAQFTSTTGGPGYYSMCKQFIHFWDVPNDWHRLLDENVLENMPVHRAGEPNEEYPAYYFTAVHSQSGSIALSSMSPLLQQKEAKDGDYKHYIAMLCCPTERIIREAKEDWEQYEEKIRKAGMVPEDAAYVPYPYTEEYIAEQFKIHEAYVARRFAR